LTLAVLEQAIESRQPVPGLVHHTDRGSNYTSGEYQQRLAKIGAVVSHSRPGRPQENGMAESFNKTVSFEKLFLEDYTTLAEAEAGLGEWIEKLYNTHSATAFLDRIFTASRL
jgi:putative transposase